ncbi:MAG TPA: LysM peptidoglycan-binding domain-containing M23 family metallopeptidase [bacterium]
MDRHPKRIRHRSSLLHPASSIVAAGALLAGCAAHRPLAVETAPVMPEHPAGTYHTLQAGETLWRLGRAFGVDAVTLGRANRVGDPGHVAAGMRLFIPLPRETAHFLWPAHGRLERAQSGAILFIRAADGTEVRASRTGRVAAITPDVADAGATIILDHLDGYHSLYAGLRRLFVAPGTFVKQGTALGDVDGRPLQFEIWYGTRQLDVLPHLPELG